DESLIPTLGSTDHPDGSAVSVAAEKMLAAVRFQPRYVHAGRHFQGFKHFSRNGIYAPQFAGVVFPGAVPEFALDPGAARHVAVGFEAAQDRAGLGVDLVNDAFLVPSDPERSVGPGQAGTVFAPGRGYRAHDMAVLRIDFLDPSIGDLKNMLAVKGGSRIGCD